jgi:hypothetical protein
MASRKANIEANQTLHDLAMQTYGNPEGYFKLAEDNGLDDPTVALQPGGELAYLETISPVQQAYIRRGRRVATANALPPEAPAHAFGEGFDQSFDTLIALTP